LAVLIPLINLGAVLRRLAQPAPIHLRPQIRRDAGQRSCSGLTSDVSGPSLSTSRTQGIGSLFACSYSRRP
jgi:hypothetical protein